MAPLGGRKKLGGTGPHVTISKIIFLMHKIAKKA